MIHLALTEYWQTTADAHCLGILVMFSQRRTNPEIKIEKKSKFIKGFNVILVV